MFLFLEATRKPDVSLSKAVMAMYNLKLGLRFNPANDEIRLENVPHAEVGKVLRALTPSFNISSMTMSLFDKELESLINTLDNISDISELQFLPNVDKRMGELADISDSASTIDTLEDISDIQTEAFIRILPDETPDNYPSDESTGMYMKLLLEEADSAEEETTVEEEIPELVAEEVVQVEEEVPAPVVEEVVQAVEETPAPVVEKVTYESVPTSFSESVEKTFATGINFYHKKYIEAGKLPTHQEMASDFAQIIDFPTSTFATPAFSLALKIPDHKLSYDKIANELYKQYHYAAKLTANTLKSDFKKWIRSNPSIATGVASSFPALLKVFRMFVKNAEDKLPKQNNE